MKYILPLFALVLIACGGSGAEESDQEKIRDEVRSYLFLDDSIEVAANVVDTILVEELDGMLATIEDNLDKVQMDIDTLGSMIDELSYSNLEDEPVLQAIPVDKVLCEQAIKDVPILQYKLKMAELQATKMAFQQSKRVMLHLRRAQLNSIAGYEIAVNYQDQGEEIELGFIMNTEFRIID